MFIIPREWWGARPPKNTPFRINTPTPELWLHHAAGAVLPGDDTVSPIDYQRIRAIQNFHMDKRGWNDIAYSWLVDTDGYVFEGRGAGVAGGHTKGHNTVSHAICVMGNYDLQPVDPDLLPRIAELVRYTHSQGWTPRLFSGGHRDVGATSCPGNKLYPQLPELNRLIMEDDDMTPAEMTEWADEYFGVTVRRAGYFRGMENVGEHRTSQLLADTINYQPLWMAAGADGAPSLYSARSTVESRNYRLLVALTRAVQDHDGSGAVDVTELAGLILEALSVDEIADAIEAGPLVDAVRDELNRRLEH